MVVPALGSFCIVLYAQALLECRTGCGVLQLVFRVGIKILLYCKSGQGTFVETAQDKLLFAGVGVDVTDSVDSGYVGLKRFQTNTDVLAFDIQSPVSDRTKVRRQAIE